MDDSDWRWHGYCVEDGFILAGMETHRAQLHAKSCVYGVVPGCKGEASRLLDEANCQEAKLRVEGRCCILCNLADWCHVFKPLQITNAEDPAMFHKLTYWTLTLLFFVSLGIAFEQQAHAYTDPGSALLLFQSLGAVASGVIFYFRRQVKRLFVRSESAKPVNARAVMSRVDS